MKPAPRPPRAGSQRRESGMALVAVMWMVAALSLLVSSLIYATRAEIRSVQQLRDATDATALGDAAMQLAALDLHREQGEANRWQRRAYRFDGHEVAVTVVPSGGLVNINRADMELLTDLLVHAGGITPQQADRLVSEISLRRKRNPPVGLDDDADRKDVVRAARRQSRFDVIEDLLGVPGFPLELFDTIQSFITVRSPSGTVDPQAAPPGLMGVLAAGDAGTAERFLERREADDPAKDMTGINHITRGARRDRFYRLDVEVVSNSGVVYRRTGWVDLSRVADGPPFRWLDLYPARAVGTGS